MYGPSRVEIAKRKHFHKIRPLHALYSKISRPLLPPVTREMEGKPMWGGGGTPTSSNIHRLARQAEPSVLYFLWSLFLCCTWYGVYRIRMALSEFCRMELRWILPSRSSVNVAVSCLHKKVAVYRQRGFILWVFPLFLLPKTFELSPAGRLQITQSAHGH